eukprot:1844398-Amphidinium_carterae.1
MKSQPQIPSSKRSAQNKNQKLMEQHQQRINHSKPKPAKLEPSMQPSAAAWIRDQQPQQGS